MQDNIQIFKHSNKQLLRERAADYQDVMLHLLSSLSGHERPKSHFPDNAIVIANDLLPSQVADLSNVAGVVLAQGSTTSHVAIMLKNAGVASLVQVGPTILSIPNDQTVVLDDKHSCLLDAPSAEVLAQYTAARVEIQLHAEEDVAQAHQKAITVDQYTITVTGNIGQVDVGAKALSAGAEGIGLLRTEFIYSVRTEAPEEVEESQLLQSLVDELKGYPVTIRTLDAGGDKPLRYYHIPEEENPMLGLRGIRTYPDNLNVIRSHLRAMLRVKPQSACKIMLPMVSGLEEILWFKSIVDEEHAQLRSAGLSEATRAAIGIMVEIPSAALMAERIAPHVDFFSIGTNDLAQYTLAMDRGHSAFSATLSHYHPAVLQLIATTVAGARSHQREVSICGTMASETQAIPLLIGLGVTHIAAAVPVIPKTKALIRRLRYADCQALAKTALQLDSAKAVRHMCTEWLNQMEDGNTS